MAFQLSQAMDVRQGADYDQQKYQNKSTTTTKITPKQLTFFAL
jgi:hypothetical protein